MAAAGGARVLQGALELAHYRGVLLDQFGVLHDGRQPYPGAVEAVAALAGSGVRLLILSNSSRRSSGALGKLEGMGFDPKCFAGVVTSGEVTFERLTTRPDEWWQRLGRRCLHFTWGDRGAISLDGLGLEVTADPEQADFILAHGTEAVGSGGSQPPQPATLEEMCELLARCAARTARGGGALPMVVANPDVVTVDGAQLRVMPGTLARRYAELGGAVHLMGKPAPVIYEAALAMLGLPQDQVVAVGDSLEHDIAGARGAGIAAVFVCGGIHAERALDAAGGISAAELPALYGEHGVKPDFVMPAFRP